MTNEEAKDALFKRSPVIYNGIEYHHVSAIIYRCGKYNDVLVSAELTDKNNRSVTIAKVQDIKAKEGDIP